MARVRPTLLAFLICGEVALNELQEVTLVRVFDTFNIRMEVSTEDEEAALKEIHTNGIRVGCTVFTKWGMGEGTFTEELRWARPDGVESVTKSQYEMGLPGGFCFHQTRRIVTARANQSGDYSFRLYLDGELVAKHPLKVNIEVKVAPSSAR